jgi:hypothetical protein
MGTRNGENETITATMQGFNETWSLDRIAQRSPELCNRDVDGMVKIAEAFLRPDPVPQFLPRDYFAWVLQESSENLKWLLLEFDLDPCLAQLSGAQVNLEDPESYGLFSAAYFAHRRSFKR